MVTGIDARIKNVTVYWTGSQEESGTIWSKIVSWISGGKVRGFFRCRIDEHITARSELFNFSKIVLLCFGEPSKKQEQIAKQLVELMENG